MAGLKASLRVLLRFWKGFRLLPSAQLVLLQFFILILSLLSNDSTPSRSVTWLLGVIALLLVAKMIRQTPAYTALGLIFVGGAFIFSVPILFGYEHVGLIITTHAFEASAYFCAAYGLIRYMFADRYLTKDELFAAAAVFTLIAWGFAFLYNICQLVVPYSFHNPNRTGPLQTWLDILFLSFSLQSATGLADLMPVSPAARVLAMLQMFGGVMYLALIVSRLIVLQYISHSPRTNKDKS